MTARQRDLAGQSGAKETGRVPGIVTEVLPNAMYRVRLERGQEIMAHVAGDLRMSFIRILAGDRVSVEVSPFDPTKGRIAAHSGTGRDPRGNHQQEI